MPLQPVLDVLDPIIRADEEDDQIGVELCNDLECGEMICGAQARHTRVDSFDWFSLLCDAALQAMGPGRLIVEKDFLRGGSAYRVDPQSALRPVVDARTHAEALFIGG